nr:S1 RNA-binding domain-containing protein [bacterium]
KQLQENPWPTLSEDYPVGRQVEGKVIRMLDHGMVVEISAELEGFVPVGHLAIPKIHKPQYHFKETEALPLHVIKMDSENRRIVLSVAEFFKDEPREELDKFIAEHPLLEDVVAAEKEAEAEAGRSDDGYADDVDDYPPEVELAEATPPDEAESETPADDVAEEASETPADKAAPEAPAEEASETPADEAPEATAEPEVEPAVEAAAEENATPEDGDTVEDEKSDA